MAFYGKPVRRQEAGSLTGDASAKIKQDLSRYEQSIKDMQSCLRSLNKTVAEIYGETLPRTSEFQRALQDEDTLLDNFARDVHEVEEPLRRYEQQYDSNERSSDRSGVASANRKSEFVSTVIGTLINGQNVYFSESFKVSQVLMDIVTQTKHLPTPREARLAKELAEEIGDKTGERRPQNTSANAVTGGVSPFAQSIGGHRGLGSLIGGAYGSQQPQARSMAAQIKPASRFSSPNPTKAAPARIYV